jgi:hypothetical protein
MFFINRDIPSLTTGLRTIFSQAFKFFHPRRRITATGLVIIFHESK